MKNKIRNLFINNGLWVFFVCIIISALLRLYLQTEPTSTKKIVVPLQITNLPKTMAITERSADKVMFTVTARKRILPYVTDKEIKAFVDLRDAALGEAQKFTIKYTLGKIDKNDIDKISFEPVDLSMAFEPMIEKNLPIRLFSEGDVQKEYSWNWSITPDKIRLRGPQSVLRNRTYVKTQRVVMTDRKQSFQTLIKLDVPRGVQYDEKIKYLLKVFVQEAPNEVRLLGNPMVVLGLDSRLKIINDPMPTFDVSIRASKFIISRLKKEDISVQVDLKTIKKPGDYTVAPIVLTPKEVAWKQCFPEKITLTIKQKGPFER